jgi:glycogen debranching enzyme
MTDIVERLRVKWDSMGDMANAERDEAAYAIICLRNECAMEVAHTKEIRQQVTDLQAKLGRIMEGLEGTCMTCEPVGVRNQQMQRDIATLKAQRNVARREVCRSRASCIQGKSPLHIAEALGWDCFADQNADTSEHL